MIELFDPALAAQNDTGAMAVLNELVLAMTADGGGQTLDSALAEVAAGHGGETALGQALKEALAGSASHGALAVLDLLIDKLAIDPAEAALAAPGCGCRGRGGSGGESDDGLVLMSFTDSSSGGDDGEPNDDVDGDGEPDDDIVVTGEKPRTVDEGDSGYEGDPGSDVGSGDDGAVGGGDMPGENDTPCVDQKPTGAELSDINDVAKVAATKLGTMQDSTGWEWGALIYRGTDGLLHISEAFTAKHPDELTGATVTLPSGAYVVAYVHTHPIDMTMDQRMLSDPDRRFISDLLGNENINVDDNLLSYVVTKDDAGLHYYDEYKTYVYDKSERISTSAGCTL